MDDSTTQTGAADHTHADDHPDFLQHHFDSPAQQFEAAKLGMWMFLATEVLLFGGLFCAYAVYRGNHPDVFEYGSQFLDTSWGAINTVVLILSSFTMATAVWCAQVGHRRLLALFLFLTLLFAGDFLVIKYIEYSHKFHEHLVGGTAFYEAPYGYELPETKEPGEAVAVVSTVSGKDLWTATCRSCHGAAGEGLPGQGKDIRGSEFISQRTDDELLAFIKVGRMPFDPLNTTGIQMPPRGGNPLLSDGDLMRIIGYMRTFEGFEGAATAGAAEGETATESEAFWIPRSTIPLAQTGPSGLAAPTLAASEGAPGHGEQIHHAYDPDRPANAHMFFTIYFLMTGLHGLHVAAGMAVIAWLLIRTLRGHFSAAYFTPVDLGGLYWHIVDLIWIFLFPLLYLIR